MPHKNGEVPILREEELMERKHGKAEERNGHFIKSGCFEDMEEEEPFVEGQMDIPNGNPNGDLTKHLMLELPMVNAVMPSPPVLKTGFSCYDPAIMTSLSDFNSYTDGLRNKNFNHEEVSRPKKIYRVVLTGGK
jgi:hypothetical protein